MADRGFTMKFILVAEEYAKKCRIYKRKCMLDGPKERKENVLNLCE